MNGVTDVDKQQYPAPKHSRVGWWLLAAGMLLAAMALGAALHGYQDARTPPPTPVVMTVTVEQTRIVKETVLVPTERTIVVYQPTVVEIPVTRVVYVNTYYTPTPPQEGKG